MALIGSALDGAVDIVDLIAKGLHRSPDETALVSAKTCWTWGQLESAANRLAGNLLALGLEPGERLATLMPNRVALLVLYLACFRAGLVVTPLNYRYTPREIDHALEVSDAALLFSQTEREADWAASRLVGRLRRGIVTYGGPTGAGTRSIRPARSTAWRSNSRPRRIIDRPQSRSRVNGGLTKASEAPAKSCSRDLG